MTDFVGNLVEKHFPDSTEHTNYTITIVSENGEKFKASVDNLDVEEILELLV
jgi:hypothetical protein